MVNCSNERKDVFFEERFSGGWISSDKITSLFVVFTDGVLTPSVVTGNSGTAKLSCGLPHNLGEVTSSRRVAWVAKIVTADFVVPSIYWGSSSWVTNS